MKLALSFFASAVVALSAIGADRGIIGVTVHGTPDFRAITSVLPDSPAAHAGIRIGDQIVAIGDFPTSKLQTVRELLSKILGPPGSEIELQLKRSGSEPILRVRIRRVAPATLEPRKIPPNFERYQARSHTNGLTPAHSHVVLRSIALGSSRLD